MTPKFSEANPIGSGAKSSQSMVAHVLLCLLLFGAVMALQNLFGKDRALWLVQGTLLGGVGIGIFLILSKQEAKILLQRPLALGSVTQKATIKSFGAWNVLVFLGASLGALAYSPSSQPRIGEPFRWQEMLGFHDPSEIPNRLAALLVAPVVEELYFRGVLLRGLQTQKFFGRDNMPPLSAVSLSATIFFLFHLPAQPEIWSQAWAQGGLPLNFGPLLLGWWTGLMAVKDRSLWWCVAGHCLANLFAPIWSHL